MELWKRMIEDDIRIRVSRLSLKIQLDKIFDFQKKKHIKRYIQNISDVN